MTAHPSTPAGLKRLGRYRIVRPLSKGGMALVYEARRESLEGVSPRVAIKLILPQHAGSETFKELFINEARLGASMQHQNLVQIQDFDCEGDRFYLVMEYVEGLTLRKCIHMCSRHGRKIPLEVIAELGRQACAGLHYAHEASDEQGRHLQLVHRDLKPSNIIVGPHGGVKVLDFGISKGRLMEERRGSVKGTWGYMAPEQAMGQEVDPTSDVFGLATVLYELAALKPMFRDRDKDKIRRLLRDDHAARMGATLEGPYAALVRVLVRALQRDPKARYASAEAFGKALLELVPDPITAQNKVQAFYEEIEQLQSIPAPQQASTVQDASSAQAPSDPVSVLPTSAAPVVSANVSMTITAMAAMLVLVAAGVLLARSDFTVFEATPAQAPLAERGPPTHNPTLGTPAALPQEDPGNDNVASVAVVRKPAQAETDEVVSAHDEPVPPAMTGEQPPSVISAIQPAEVYIDGQFAGLAPVTKVLKPGSYPISIVATDGRSHTFELQVDEGRGRKKTWDFDRVDWR